MSEVGSANKGILKLAAAAAAAAANSIAVLQGSAEKEMTFTQLVTFLNTNLGAITPTSLTVTSAINASSGLLSVFGQTKTSQAAALTAASGSVLSSVYDATEQGEMSNMRVRIGEMSSILKIFGFTA